MKRSPGAGVHSTPAASNWRARSVLITSPVLQRSGVNASGEELRRCHMPVSRTWPRVPRRPSTRHGRERATLHASERVLTCSGACRLRDPTPCCVQTPVRPSHPGTPVGTQTASPDWSTARLVSDETVVAAGSFRYGWGRHQGCPRCGGPYIRASMDTSVGTPHRRNHGNAAQVSCPVGSRPHP